MDELADDWLVAGAVRDVQSVQRDRATADPQNIDGVLFRAIPPVVTTKGQLNEILRCEWLGNNTLVDQVFVSSLLPGAVSAWHAHGAVTDRLFIVSGTVLIVLYDHRRGSPTYQAVQEFRLGCSRSGLLTIPPKVWHGIKNIGSNTAHLLNAVDVGYCYEMPDHWRLSSDSNAVPYRF